MISNRCSRITSILTVTVGVIVLVTGCTSSTQQPKPSSENNKEKSLFVVSWGGDLQKTERDAFFDPFQKETGIVVKDGSFTGQYGKIKAQVQEGRVEWDVVEVEEDMVLSGGNEGLFEPIDYNVVPADSYFPDATGKYGVGALYASTVLTWNKGRIPSGTRPPSSWRDLWDLKRFPGKRGFYKDPRSTLEIALLADGVEPGKLYPLDVDRAFHKLDQIKKSIVWWSGGSEFEQKLLSDYTISSGWNGRVWSLQHQGKPVGYTFAQGLLQMDWWVIPKGSPRRDIAMKFLAFTSHSDGERILAEQMAYGPVNKQLAGTLSDSIRTGIPSDPSNLKQQVRINAKWWSSHDKEVRSKWESWLLN